MPFSGSKTEKQLAQIELVRELLNSVSSNLTRHIHYGHIPLHWDGHELREWIADTFDQQRTDLMKKDRKRRKAYANDLAISNL